MSNLFGTGINQIPTNGMLGNLAFQDKSYVSVDAIGIGTTFVDSGTVGQPLQVSGGAYVSGNLGIGTTTPSSALTVVGNVLVSGASTLGITTTTNLTSQTLNVSGVSTLGVTSTTNLISQTLNVSGISTLGIITVTNLTAQQLNVSGITTLGITTISQLNVSGITTVGFITATNLNVSGVGTFLSSGLKIRNPANTFGYTITGSAIVADRILNLPVITATDTVATLGLTQTFSAAQTFSGNLTLSTGNFSHTGTTQSFTANSYTTGAVTIGGPLQVGAITVGQATTSQTLNLATGVSGIGTTKTINVGTAGATGSLTQINIGPTAGVGTITVNSGTNLGIGSLTPISKLDVVGDARFTGVVTATTFSGNATSASYANVAGVSTALQIPRNFSITGNFVTATAVSFDGTGNVALAATIPLDAIGLGTYTSGDYVKNITGTANQITVTSGSGEGSAPVLSLPTSIVFPQDVTVTRDLQVTRNLSVTGTISIGGTSAFVNVQQLRVTDADLILGVRTDITGNDSSNDTTANTGGIAVASTEGSPLVSLYSVAIGETASPTYKKIMWFKTGSFSGLGTDAWLINYAVGIGSTQFPTGTRLAAGSVQFTERDLAVVRNINASGVVTTTTLDVGGNVKISGISTLGITTATNLTSQQLNVSGITTLGITSTTNLTSQQLNVSGITTLGVTSTTNLTSQQLNVSGISTLQSTTLIGTGTSTGTAGQVLQVTGINSSVYIGGSVGIGSTNPASKLTVAGQIQSIGAGSTLTGGGQIFLNGVTSNRIDFNSNGIAPPTFTTRSAGSKLVLYPSVGGSTVDYAFGIEPATLWSSIPDSPYQFKWYAGTTNIATLFGTGELVLGSTNITGTASQPLQVTGGAAFYGTGASVGIGTTIAPYTLSITNNSTTSTVGLANALADFTSSVNLYSQINIRNALSGTNASSDVVVTADTGTDSTNFLDMGINNSGFSTSTWTVNGATDGYLYTSNTNLSIGVATTGKYLSFFAGGTLISNEQMRVTTSGVGIGTTNPTSALTVWGDASVSGVITAITFSGNATSVIGGIGSITQLQVTGVSTFTNGPVLVGISTVTGTASQNLQVTGGAYIAGDSNNNALGIGETNPQYPLDIKLSSGTNSVMVNIQPSTTTRAAGIRYINSGSGNLFTGLTNSSGGLGGLSGFTPYAAVFGLNTGTSPLLLITNNTEAIRIDSSQRVGIGTTNPTSKLQVQGDTYVTGVVTATTFIGALTGTASSIKGGAGGSIPYQTAADTTTFLANGTGGFILQSNGGTSAPSWVPAAPSGAVTGLVVRDFNNTIVGTSGSISQLTFSTGFSVTGTTGAAGIATITIADNINFVGTGISISGISTFDGVKISSGIVTSTNPGVTTVVYYGDGSKLSNIITGVSISTNTTNQSQYIPYVSGTGSTTGFGVTTTGLVFNPSSNNLGIGTASPAFKADIAGDARVTSTNKMRFGGTAGTSNFYIQYNSTTNSLDFVAG